MAQGDPRMLFSWYSGDYCTDPAFADLDPERRANPSMDSWDDPNYLDQQRRRLPANIFKRLHLNLPGSASSFVDMADYDRRVDPDADPILIDRHLQIWIGLDGSINRDWTAIVAVTYDRQTKKVRVIWHKIFKPTLQREINFEDIIDFLAQMGGKFSIQKDRISTRSSLSVSRSV